MPDCLHIMCPQNESIIFHIRFNINEGGCGRVVGCHGIVANYIMGIGCVICPCNENQLEICLVSFLLREGIRVKR